MIQKIEIQVLSVKITDWIDASSRDGVVFIPKTMSANASINSVYTENIMIPYFPITSKEEIIKAIIKTLQLS